VTVSGAPGLEALLDLDGEVFCLDSGYWTKFEVKRVEASVAIPHGIRYSLTLYDRFNRRISDSTMRTRVSPNGSSSGQERLPGTTNTKPSEWSPASSSRRRNCWKIPGMPWKGQLSQAARGDTCLARY